jgi:hypothetical protein
MDIDAVVVWGHPLHSHTHSYIHNAFVRGFDYLRYKWYWLDDNKPFKSYGITLPEKCLYITEGQVDKNIILNPKSYYLLHNCDLNKYRKVIPENHILLLQVYLPKVEAYSEPLNDSRYIRFDGKSIYMPWGTDLHPHEIDKNIDMLEQIHKNPKKVCHFVGMILDNPWKPCREVCNSNGIQFSNVGGFCKNNVSIDENVRRVQEAIIAPAFQEPWQLENGYIPCRIFKNISYGKMGVTNNKVVQELFNDRLIYDPDIRTATKKAIDNARTGQDLNLLKELMLEVRNKHTYINRIKDIFEAFSKLK